VEGVRAGERRRPCVRLITPRRIAQRWERWERCEQMRADPRSARGLNYANGSAKLRAVDYDGAGWAIGRIDLLDAAASWSLLSPDPEARIDEHRWAHQAATFFRADLSLVQKKSYPAGTLPLADAVEVDIAPRGEAPTRVLVVTAPIDRALAIRAAADRGARAIGGAGMDALVARARRVWQVRVEVAAGGDERAPLALAAVLAAVHQAPIVPPDEVTLFGVKGARTRLEARGWRT